MILSVEDLKARVDCGSLSDVQIADRLAAIEELIRSYTNNNYQNRHVRFEASSVGFTLAGTSSFLSPGDTVQISASGVNDGIYVVALIGEDSITVDRPLKATDFNLVTLIEYPDAVRQCAIDLFAWRLSMADKVGIKSETLSRHSVSYEDSQALYMGYPTGILKGLNLYKKVRC